MRVRAAVLPFGQPDRPSEHRRRRARSRDDDGARHRVLRGPAHRRAALGNFRSFYAVGQDGGAAAPRPRGLHEPLRRAAQRQRPQPAARLPHGGARRVLEQRRHAGPRERAGRRTPGHAAQPVRRGARRVRGGPRGPRRPARRPLERLQRRLRRGLHVLRLLRRPRRGARGARRGGTFDERSTRGREPIARPRTRGIARTPPRRSATRRPWTCRRRTSSAASSSAPRSTSSGAARGSPRSRRRRRRRPATPRASRRRSRRSWPRRSRASAPRARAAAPRSPSAAASRRSRASPASSSATSSTTSCPSPPAAGAAIPRRRARASPGAAQVHEGEVNWGTAFANAVALAVASSIFVVFRLPAYAAFAARRGAVGDRLHAALDRVAGSFCGALSGFGAYSEDVAQTLREHDPDGALANVAVNAIVALAFKSLLLPIFDGALEA